jgi:hypothetical protein
MIVAKDFQSTPPITSSGQKISATIPSENVM